MLQRFKYTAHNPTWELVPLPMDGQDNLSCNLSCDTSDNQNCCDYTIKQNSKQDCSDPTYFANPVDGTGFDNHKAFSVYIEDEQYNNPQIDMMSQMLNIDKGVKERYFVSRFIATFLFRYIRRLCKQSII